MNSSITNAVYNTLPKVMIFIVTILTAFFASLILKYPLIGIEVEEKDNNYYVTTIYPKSWGNYKPIKNGDQILKINGQDPELHGTIKHFNRIEMANSITVKSGHSDPITHTILYKDLRHQYGILLVIPFLFSVSTISLGIYLYVKKKEDKAAIILIYFLLSLGIGYISAYGSARGSVVGHIVNNLTLPGSLLLFVHFLNSYFSGFQLRFIHKKTLRLLTFVYILTVVFSSIFMFEWERSGMKNFYLIIFLFFLCILLVIFVRFYFKNKNSEGKGSLKILMFTLIIAFFPFVSCYVIPQIFFKNEVLSAEISAGYLLIIPIAFVYLQLAEKLFDIDYLISRFRYYSLITIPFAFLITTIIHFNNDSHFQSSYILSTFFIIFVSTVLFLYLKEYLDYKNRRHLFSQKYSYETSLYQFFQKIKYETKVDNLILLLMNEIKEVLMVKEVYSITLENDPDLKHWTVKYRSQDRMRKIREIENVYWDNYHLGSIIGIPSGFCIIISEDINSRDIIFCGLKKYRTNLNLQEKIWLETIAFFSGILLENLKLIEGLFKRIEDYKVKIEHGNNGHPYWLSRLLFSISEKERANLSNDLHDSVLQDQLQLLREVDAIMGRVDNPIIRQELKNLKERMLDNIHLIRETCNELRPPFLSELGIIQSILNLIEQTKLRSNFILYSNLDQSIQKLNKDYELMLYRVVQELLNNAMKHSQASEVWISLKNNKHNIILSYQDNGVGMDMTELNDSFHTMGITGIKERVLSLGGKVWIESSPGNGMQVTIELKTGGNNYD